MSETSLSARLAQVRAVVAERQAASGWTHSVTILAVTKGHGPEAVFAAAEAGLVAVGENRVSEALDKQEACAGVPVDWHLIGTLQRKKVRQAAGRFALIHSVDRLDLAREISDRTVEGTSQDLLLQVNCSNEPQKGGVEPDQLEALLAAVCALPRLAVRGLMTMAALTTDESVQRRAFASLRDLRDRVQLAGFHLPELSMGMSGDYGAAVAEGATILRLGTVLYGAAA